MAIYVDMGIAVILLIALIVGAIRGFAKQFTKGFCGIIALIGSIYFALLIMPILQKTSIFKSFAAFATGWFKGDAYTTTIFSEEGLVEVLSDGFLKIMSSLSPRIWNSMISNNMSTLGAYLGNLCARLIVGIVLWIVLLLVIILIFIGIRKLLKKLAELPVLRTLDKIFGAIWSVAIAYVVLVCFIITAAEIIIIKWLPNTNVMNAINNLINESYLFKFLHETNAIGAYIARLFGIDLSAMTTIV